MEMLPNWVCSTQGEDSQAGIHGACVAEQSKWRWIGVRNFKLDPLFSVSAEKKVVRWGLFLGVPW